MARLAATFACVTALTAAPFADAAWVEVTLTGTVTGFDEEGMQFGGSVEVGTPFVVFASFDTSTPSGDSGHVFASPPALLEVDLGSYHLNMPLAFQAFLSADFETYGYEYLQMYGDELVVSGASPPPGADHNQFFFSLLNSSDDAAIPSDSLEDIIPFLSNPALWDEANFAVDFGGEDVGYASAYGTIETSVVVVPEPAGALTLLPWLALLARRALARANPA